MANKPFGIFEKTHKRAVDLLDLRETHPALPELDDLTRAAVLLSVAGFDRYFTSKFCDVLVAHLKSQKKIGADLYTRIGEAGFTTEVALSLISESVDNRNSRPFRKIRTIVQNSLSTHTTHREDVIDELFMALGLKNLCQNASRKSGRMTILRSVTKLVDLRNEIAHEAHVKNTGEPRYIDKAIIRNRVSDLMTFVSCCDEIIDNKFGRKPASSA